MYFKKDLFSKKWERIFNMPGFGEIVSQLILLLRITSGKTDLSVEMKNSGILVFLSSQQILD